VKESTKGPRGAYSRDLVYFLDGRGESNKGFTQDFVYDSKTILKDKTILIDATIVISGGRGGKAEIEEWQLSADGKKLTIKTKITGSLISSSASNARAANEILSEKIFRLEN
jgi:hypothetical protein